MISLYLVSSDLENLAANLKKIEPAVNQLLAVNKVGQINFKLVGSAEMAALNQRYAGDAYPTDVLSFPYEGSGASELGDVALNSDQASVQAKEYGVSRETELINLALHGTLHILGFDHASEADRAAMQDLQGEILKTAGLSTRQFEWKV